MGEGRGMSHEGITKLKTNVISAAAERKQYLLLSEACLAACSGGWVQPYRMTLLLNKSNPTQHGRESVLEITKTVTG